MQLGAGEENAIDAVETEFSTHSDAFEEEDFSPEDGTDFERRY